MRVGLDDVAKEGGHGDATVLDLRVAEPPNQILVRDVGILGDVVVVKATRPDVQGVEVADDGVQLLGQDLEIFDGLAGAEDLGIVDGLAGTEDLEIVDGLAGTEGRRGCRAGRRGEGGSASGEKEDGGGELHDGGQGGMNGTFSSSKK